MCNQTFEYLSDVRVNNGNEKWLLTVFHDSKSSRAEQKQIPARRLVQYGTGEELILTGQREGEDKEKLYV